MTLTATSSCLRRHVQLVLQRPDTGHYCLALYHCCFCELAWSSLNVVNEQSSLDVALCYVLLNPGLRAHHLMRETEKEIIQLHFARYYGEENSQETHKSAWSVKELQVSLI